MTQLIYSSNLGQEVRTVATFGEEGGMLMESWQKEVRPAVHCSHVCFSIARVIPSPCSLW